MSDLATELGISTATVLSYLRSNVLKDAILTEAQLQCRLEMCSALSLRNSREPFLSRIVTYGEKLLYLEYRKRLPYFPLDASRNLEQDIPGKKILLIVWWSSRGVIYHQFVKSYEKMTKGRFSRHITKVHQRILANDPELADGRGPIILCDNPHPYITRELSTKMYQCSFEILPYPSNANDLLPTHFYFFNHLIKHMEHKDFMQLFDLSRYFRNFIATRPQEFFANGINELASRWKKCIESNGHYIF